MAITQSLREEIAKKSDAVVLHPEYFLKKANMVKTYLCHIRDAHSFWLEHPDMRMGMIGADRADMTKLRRVARKGARRLRDALYFLSGAGRGELFEAVVTPDLVVEVGKIVEPEINAKGIRDGRIQGWLPNYVPPNYMKIHELLDETCEFVRESDQSPIEKAAYIHLHLAGIQPFTNGNKRTARLFQDRILDSHDMPPAVIPSGERDVYLDVLEQALVGERDGDVKAQRPFYDYIGGKVNAALDDIMGDLDLVV